jgi:hypothetical protein
MVLERRAATCGLQNPLRAEWFNMRLVLALGSQSKMRERIHNR